MAERIHIDRCPVDCLNLPDSVAGLLDAMAEGRRGVLVAPVNAYTVVEAHRNTALRDALEQMEVNLPDGFWLQLAAPFLRRPSPGHVPTVPLTLELLRRMAREGGRVYLLGAEGGVVRAAAENLQRRFPGITLAGAHDGYFHEDDETGLIEEINAAQPDLLLIGISSPKRDFLMTRWREVLNVPVTIGVGGMIDILGGKTPEGPNWLRHVGLMWLYRLLREPRRLLKRYTIINTLFVYYVLRQAISGRDWRPGKDIGNTKKVIGNTK